MKILVLNKAEGAIREIELAHLRPENEIPLPAWVTSRTAVRALKTYYRKSRTAGVRAKCVDCAGTAQEAKRCECFGCPLWPFRPGATRGEVPPGVPPEEILAAFAGSSDDEAEDGPEDPEEVPAEIPAPVEAKKPIERKRR